MEAVIDQLIAAITGETALRTIVVWLSAAAAFVLVLGSTILIMNFLDPVRKRVGALGPGKVDENASGMKRPATSSLASMKP